VAVDLAVIGSGSDGGSAMMFKNGPSLGPLSRAPVSEKLKHLRRPLQYFAVTSAGTQLLPPALRRRQVFDRDDVKGINRGDRIILPRTATTFLPTMMNSG